MGFHVRCTGADLLKELTHDPERFLGRPYAVYAVALATQIDDYALRWLQDYEMALDSLFGPIGAFFLFYNTARFDVRPDTGFFLSRQFHHYDRSSQGLDIAGKVLREGGRAVDDVVRFQYPREMNKDAFVRSMTYESDSIARDLGIIDKLPCIVLFDDPREDRFFIIPLIKNDKSLLDDLRELLSRFSTDDKYAEFFKQLLDWHRLAGIRDAHLEAVTRLKTRSRHHLRQDIIAAETYQALELLRNGKPKRFRIRLNEIEGGRGLLPWQQIRSATNRIAQLQSLSRSIAKHSEDLESELGEKIKYKAVRLLNVKGERFSTEGSEELKADLARAMQDEIDSLTDLILGAFGIENPQRPEITFPWTYDERRAEELNHVLLERKKLLGTMKRPMLKPHLDSMELQRKRKIAMETLRRSTSTAVENVPKLLDAIAKGFSLAGY